MPIILLESLDDERLEPYRNIKATNANRWQSRFIVEGQKLVERLLASQIQVCSLLASQRCAERVARVAPESVPVYVVPDELIDTLVGFNFHRGMLAHGVRPTTLDPIARFSSAPVRQTIIVCPAVQDPENLGAILRIGAAFGIDGVLLGDLCCDPFSRRVLRVSMGAALQLPIVVTDDLRELSINLHQRCQFELWATVLDNDALPLDSAVRPERLALVLGNEAHGLSDDWLALCQQRVTIPMRPEVDSLNVAVASGILLYHLTKPGH